jgi:hypothetical protein
MSDDIQIDDPQDTPVKSATKQGGGTPFWAFLIVLLTTACLATSLTVLILDLRYFG